MLFENKWVFLTPWGGEMPKSDTHEENCTIKTRKLECIKMVRGTSNISNLGEDAG